MARDGGRKAALRVSAAVAIAVLALVAPRADDGWAGNMSEQQGQSTDFPGGSRSRDASTPGEAKAADAGSGPSVHTCGKISRGEAVSALKTLQKAHPELRRYRDVYFAITPRDEYRSLDDCIEDFPDRYGQWAKDALARHVTPDPNSGLEILKRQSPELFVPGSESRTSASVFPRDTGIVFVHTYETANFSLGEFIGQAETMSVVESDPDN